MAPETPEEVGRKCLETFVAAQTASGRDLLKPIVVGEYQICHRPKPRTRRPPSGDVSDLPEKVAKLPWQCHVVFRLVRDVKDDEYLGRKQLVKRSGIPSRTMSRVFTQLRDRLKVIHLVPRKGYRCDPPVSLFGAN